MSTTDYSHIMAVLATSLNDYATQEEQNDDDDDTGDASSKCQF